MQARAQVAFTRVEQVPLWLPQGGAQRDGPERRAADAEDDDVVEAAARPPGEIDRLGVQRGVMGEIEKPQLVGLAPLPSCWCSRC